MFGPQYNKKNLLDRIAYQNRHLNTTPGVPLGHFYPPGGSLPSDLLAEERIPSGPIPVTMPNWEEELPNVMHQLADNPYGPEGMQNQKELDLVRYETEGPETANLQLTPPELARRARLEAEIDRELVDPNFVSQVNQMEQDALGAENQRMLVGGPPSYDPELEEMLTQEQRYLSDTLRGPLGKETWEMPNLQNPMLGSIEHNPQDYAQFGLLEEQPAFIPGPDNISAMEGFDQLNQMNQMNQENYPPGSPELSGGVVAQNNQNTGWAMNDDLRKFMLEQGLNMFNDEGW